MALQETFRFIVEASTKDASAALDSLGAKAKTTGSSLEKSISGAATKGIEGITTKFPAAGKAMESLGLSAEGLGGQLAGLAASPAALAAGGALITKTLVDWAGDFSNATREVAKFSAQTGIAAEDASRWVQVGDDAGVAADALGSSFAKLAQNINTGKLDELGVSVAKTKDGATDLAGTFLNVVNAYNSTDDAAKRAEIAQGAFGKSWTGLVRLLDEGSDSLKQSLDDVAAGQIFNEDEIAKGQRLFEATDKLSDSLDGLKTTVGGLVAGPLGDLAGVIGDITEAIDGLSAGPIGDLISKFQELGIGPLGQFKQISRAFDAIKWGAGEVGDAVSFTTDAIGALGDSTDSYVTVLPQLTQAQRDAANEADMERAALEQTNEAARLGAEAHQLLAGAIDELTNKTLGAIGAQLNYEQAQSKTTEAVAKATEETDKYGAGSKQATDATNDAAEAAINQAKQFVLMQKANAEATGATYDSAAANNDLALQLMGVANTMAPGSPLRVQLEKYIAQILAIPPTAETKVTADTTAAEKAVSDFMAKLRGFLQQSFIFRLGASGTATGTAAGTSTSPALAPVGLATGRAAPSALLGAPPAVAAPAAGMGVTNYYAIRVDVPPTVNLAEVGARITDAIDAFERRSGSRRRVA